MEDCKKLFSNSIELKQVDFMPVTKFLVGYRKNINQRGTDSLAVTINQLPRDGYCILRVR